PSGGGPYTSDYYYMDNFMFRDVTTCGLPVVTGVNNFYNDQSITISPNPASHEITIQNSTVDPLEIILSITDLMGKEIINKKISLLVKLVFICQKDENNGSSYNHGSIIEHLS